MSSACMARAAPSNCEPRATKPLMTQAKPRPPCPICGKPNVKAFRPFCSAKCADVDLGKWFSNAYVVPGEPVSTSDLDADDS